MKKSKGAWAEQEYKSVHFLNDLRLQKRAIKLLRRFSSEPESPINQVSADWAEAKAAYRFFHNPKVSTSALLRPHVENTVNRAREYRKVLAIQDTTFLNYTDHEKTSGLGRIGKLEKGGRGLIMHTVFAVTPQGLPLGILNQKIYSRPPKKIKPQKTSETCTPDKESFRWLEALINSNYYLEHSGTVVVTVCDSEGDIYSLFEYAHIVKSFLLVRSRHHDRFVRVPKFPSKDSYRKKQEKLRKYMKSVRVAGVISIQIPSRGGDLGSWSRTVRLEVRFSRVVMLSPQGEIHSNVLNKVVVYAISATEKNSPTEEDPIEWMLITNASVKTFEQAVEKINWYVHRFKVETFHRILKSGFNVESCRLNSAEALARYLTLVSVVAWRIFWITILGRTYPDSPCTLFLSDTEWKALYKKTHSSDPLPHHPVTAVDAIHLIGRLGGFLDRKSDKDPGVISLWRGWRRLNELAEGWDLADAA